MRGLVRVVLVLVAIGAVVAAAFELNSRTEEDRIAEPTQPPAATARIVETPAASVPLAESPVLPTPTLGPVAAPATSPPTTIEATPTPSPATSGSTLALGGDDTPSTGGGATQAGFTAIGLAAVLALVAMSGRYARPKRS